MRKLAPVKVYKVAGESMEPTFQAGTFLLGSPLIKPKAGHVAVVKTPRNSNKNIRKGFYSPDSSKPANPADHIKRIRKIDNTGIWMEGDNKQGSTDSRHYGYLKPKDVQAVVFLRLMR